MSIENQRLNIVELINQRTKGRFICQSEGNINNEIRSLAPPDLKNTQCVRLQRTATGTSGWRTFIIANLESETEINFALQWAASCKDELLDPEASDLYLVIIISNLQLTLEECISIEASEKSCRKFILRPNETSSDLLERTFLSPVMETSSGENILDPLTLALSETNKNHDWFNAQQQQLWRVQLLSGATGAELVDKLFNEEDSTELK